MTEEEKKDYFRKVNIDKAEHKTIVAIIALVISLLTYLFPLIYGEFDFGLVFEGVSMVLLLMAKNSMKYYEDKKAKTFVICSMLPVGFLLTYDFIALATTIHSVLDVLFVIYDYIIGEIELLLFILVQFAVLYDLNKAMFPEYYQEKNDWFYENVDDLDEKDKK